MSRLFAFFAALLVSAVTVSSACTASSALDGNAHTLRFTLEPARQSGRIHASFRRTDRNNSNWSTDFAPSDFTGLDVARLRGSGSGPIQFAMGREAGRLDCAGHGGSAMATGTCRFTANADFTNYLISRGVRRPDSDEAFALMAVNARRNIVEAIAAARYPTPDPDDLIALSALGVDARYIAGLAGAGYRPTDLDALVQFKALDITPEFIRGYVRLGYGNLSASELVQLKALDIDAEFIAGFERMGYGRLPVSDLVQLKALDITPEYVRAVQDAGTGLPSPDRLIQLRALGVKSATRRR